MKVTYDIHRNQLARVIENALCFQANNRYAENVCVALVTPKAFRDAEANTRLYQYKFKDYESDRANLLKDLKICILDKNCTQEWVYPSDIDERASRLNLRWLTYDDLFSDIPESAISKKLKSFWLAHGNYQGRS